MVNFKQKSMLKVQLHTKIVINKYCNLPFLNSKFIFHENYVIIKKAL